MKRKHGGELVADVLKVGCNNSCKVHELIEIIPVIY